MSKSKDNGYLSGAIWFLILCIPAYFTIQKAVGNVIKDKGRPQQQNITLVPCNGNSELGLSVGGLGFNSPASEDTECQARSASVTAPDSDRREFAWCSLASNIRIFGSVKRCLDYNRSDNAEIIKQVQARYSACKQKARKWRYFLRKKRTYRNCISEFNGGV